MFAFTPLIIIKRHKHANTKILIQIKQILVFQFPKVNDLPSINERFDYTTFVQFQKDRELNPYYPFKTETDYEIGMYIQRYHIGVNQGNDLIKLFRKVAPNIQLEFTNMKDLEEIWKKAPNVVSFFGFVLLLWGICF